MAKNFELLYGQVVQDDAPLELNLSDIEDALISLRKWKNENQFKIMHEQILGSAGLMEYEAQYTQLAETVLAHAIEIAKTETETSRTIREQ